MKNSRRKKQSIEFTHSKYMENVSSHPEKYAILPKSLVAEIFNKSQAWVSKHIREGVLEVVELENDQNGRVTSYISLRSVLDFEKKAKDEDINLIKKIKKILISSARKRKTIIYSKLMDKVGLSSTVPSDRSRIGVLLGVISEETYKKNGIMLSALAVLKSSGIPSESFFDLAEELEHESYSEDFYEEFFNDECEDVYDLVEKGKIK